jgi:hypothetical protein
MGPESCEYSASEIQRWERIVDNVRGSEFAKVWYEFKHPNCSAASAVGTPTDDPQTDADAGTPSGKGTECIPPCP